MAIKIHGFALNTIVLRMAKTLQSFDHSECNRIKPFSTSGLVHLYQLGKPISSSRGF